MTSGAIALVLASLGTTSGPLETAATTAWFLNSYVPASRRVENVYCHLTMHAATEYLAGPRQGSTRHIRYTGFDGRYRIDSLRPTDGDCTGTMIVNGDDSVIIHRDDSCRLRGVCRVETAPPDIVLDQIRLSVRLPFAPWCFCRSSIRRMLLDESTRIFHVGLETDSRYGRVCDVDWGIVDHGRMRQEGRFRFAVDHSWVLLEGSMELESSNHIGITCRYDDRTISDVPVIRTAESWFRDAAGRKTFRRYRCKTCAAVTAPPNVFDPMIERVIAELSGSGPVHSRWQYSVAAGVLGLSLLCAVVLPFYWRRRGPFGPGLVSGPIGRGGSNTDASPLRGPRGSN
ncbi:hypothetical protein Mal4_33980 [Maioricimonas rarisocia]|uniref:Uncharacterized protein n=1 Tax=Maioricimonas rarisocia TaxID=2528026 RepID=A0A517Z9C1_9PLAN|nr:hypothetical protein [Maioricimonas rarisocia]QDU39063.1 hypothetical protein Mal4_33980 [Maioricimonas rarisocia]